MIRPLFALNFYEVIVDEAEGRINHRLIEIESEIERKSIDGTKTLRPGSRKRNRVRRQSTILSCPRCLKKRRKAVKLPETLRFKNIITF